jgi:hypothetical protein
MVALIMEYKVRADEERLMHRQGALYSGEGRE